MSPKSSAMVFSTAKSKIVKTLLFSIFVKNYKSMRSTKISGLVHFWSKGSLCLWTMGKSIALGEGCMYISLTNDNHELSDHGPSSATLPCCWSVSWLLNPVLKYLTSIWEIVLWIWYNIFCGYDFSFCKHIFKYLQKSV